MKRRTHSLALRLPELSPREALLLSYLLDRVDYALWRRHGPEMAKIAEQEGIPFLDDSDFEQTTVRKRER